MFGQAPLYAQMYRYSTKFNVSARNFVDTIPIEFEDDQIFIRALVDGKVCRFCLDTGSSQGILYRNGPITRQRIMGKMVSRDANGQRDTILAVQFPDITLGTLTVSGYVGTWLRKPVSNTKYDAVIGFDLFNKGLSAKIDIRNKVLILTDRRDFFRNEQGVRMQYRLLRFVPNIRLSPYRGCRDEALFDTGSRRLYVMARRSMQLFLEKVPSFRSQIESMEHGSRSIGTAGAERAGETAFLHIDTLTIGVFSFLDYHTLTTEGNSRVGAGLLNHGSVIILPREKEICFQPYDDSTQVTIGNRQTDIAFIPQDDRPVVGLVREGSDYYRNGFRRGDVIIAIDGRTIYTFRQFTAFPFIEDREYSFTVRDSEGNVRHVKSKR